MNQRQMNGINGYVTTGGVPVFDGNGYTVRDSGFTIGTSVPANAVFTDTTNSIATNSNAGIVRGNEEEINIDADGKMSITSSFTVQSELTNITGGENKKTLFGKIARCVADFISHKANTSIHHILSNNLSAATSGTALDAYQGKVLNDKINTEAIARANADTTLQQSIEETWNKATYAKTVADSALPLTGGSMTGSLFTQDLAVVAGKRIYFKYDTSTNLGARIFSDGRQKLALGASEEEAYYVQLGVNESAWAFCPSYGNGSIRLGSPSRRWGQIYSTNATISTSDRREKEDVQPIVYEDIKAFLQDLTPVYYRLIANPDKKYVGLIAQDVEQLMIKHNIPDDFGLLDKNPVYDDEDKPTGDFVYGLCYEQLITLMLLAMQNEILFD